MNEIGLRSTSAGRVDELELTDALRKLEEQEPHQNVPAVHCDACNAEFTVSQHVTSSTCPYCGSNIVSASRECSVVRPGAVLPFGLTKDKAVEAYRRWLASRWFAPGTLKRRGMLDDGLTGVYVPHWTFDALATTDYEGMRGDAYYETQHVTVNGRSTVRRVRKIRWSPARGTVRNHFDDLLVPASTTLDTSQVRELTPWDLGELVPYREDYLAGFRAERYNITLADGFDEGRRMMQPVIEQTIRADIGGDEQRINRTRTVYSDMTYKHVLLPVWISAYRYGGKVYRFMVNARTSEVQGRRPYSVFKIVMAILGGLALLMLMLFLLSRA
jgi:predicted RNA-binding Zn-ribbon protein involved in translation (DUF1610 family)